MRNRSLRESRSRLCRDRDRSNLPVWTALLLCPALLWAEDLPVADPSTRSDEAGPRSGAETALARGHYDEAAKLFLKAIQKDPSDLASAIGLVRSDLARGKYPEAEKAASKLAAAHADPSAKLLLAEIKILRGDAHQALPLTQSVLENHPSSPLAKYLHAEALLATGKHDEAEELLGSLIRDYNQSFGSAQVPSRPAEPDRQTSALPPSELFAMAKGLWLYASRAGDSTLAKEVAGDPEGMCVLEQIHKADPTNAEVMSFWGMCFLEKYDATEAKACFEEALKLNRHHAGAYYGLALVGLVQGNQDEALKQLARALRINPNFAEAHLVTGRIYLARDDFARAKAKAKKVLAQNPHSVEARSLLAAVGYVEGDRSEVKRQWKQISRSNPRAAIFYHLLGEDLSAQMFFPEATTFYEKAAEIDPHLWDSRFELALNLLRQGKEKEAYERMNEAFQRDPFHIWAKNTLDLMDRFETDFVLTSTPHFTLRLPKTEQPLLEAYVGELQESCYETLAKRYRIRPPAPLRADVYHLHEDFSVRTLGIPGLGALGACFGRVIAILSPRAQKQMGSFHWGAVLWHEMAHVFALEVSRHRVPRWFTEGLSTYEEKLAHPGWEREIEAELFQAFHTDGLRPIDKLAQGGDLLNLYLYGSVICEFIDTKWGFDKIREMLEMWAKDKPTAEVFKTALGMSTKEFDRKVREYLEERLRSVRLRIPFKADPKEVKRLEKAVHDDPQDVGSLVKLARIAWSGDRKQDAHSLALRALKIEPENPEALLVLGDYFLSQKRREKAISHYERAAKAGADDFTTHFRLGKLYLEKNEPDRAMAAFQKAKEAFPRFENQKENPYLVLADLYEKKGEPEKARGELEAWIAIAHEDHKTRMKLAKAYRSENQFDKAVKVLEESIYVQPADIELHAHLGRSYRQLGQREIVPGRRSEVPPFGNKGRDEASRPEGTTKSGEWSSGPFPFLSKACREFRITVWLLRQTNKDGKADKLIARFLCELGECLLEMGNVAEAQEAVDDALLQVPGYTRALEILKRIRQNED